MIGFIPKVTSEARQNESGRRSVTIALAVTLLAACGSGSALAQTGLDAGGLTFRDFAVADHGASFSRNDSIPVSGATGARLIHVDEAQGKARVGFGSINVEASVPMGWQAGDDSGRGLAFSADKSYRLIVWRVDFAFEGVTGPEHYAATKGGAIEARRPGVKAQARRLADGSALITYQNVPAGQGDREARTVYDLVMANPAKPSEGLLVTIGVPASQAERGLKLLALVKQDLSITW
jgi:hypothetical protein